VGVSAGDRRVVLSSEANGQLIAVDTASGDVQRLAGKRDRSLFVGWISTTSR
jgi:hypothetical protein